MPAVLGSRPSFCSLLSVLLGIVASACAPVARPPGTAARPDASAAVRQVHAAVLRAEDRRRIDDALRAAVTDARPDVRRLAVRALGRIGGPEAATLLAAATADSAPAVRAEAVLAIGLAREPGAATTLAPLAGDADPAVRAALATSLGLLEDSAADEPLLALLADGERSVVEAACYAAGGLERGDAAVERLIALTAAEDAPTRIAALHGLARLAATTGHLGYDAWRKARASLRELALAPDARARELAARGLAVPAHSEEDAVLRQLAADEDPRVRISAVRSLCFTGARLDARVVQALADADDRVALAAVEGLGRMSGGDVRERLVLLIMHDPRLWMKERAIAALARVDPDHAAAIANGLSRSEETSLRVETARVLVGRTDAPALAIVERLLADPEPEVRAAAIPALAAAPGRLHERLGAAVRTDPPRVRAAIARAATLRAARSALAPDDRDDVLDLLELLWQVAAPDETTTVREPVIEGAAALGDDPRAIALLRQGLAAGDWTLRRRSAELLAKQLAEPASDVGPATDEPLEHYLALVDWSAHPHAAVVTVEREGFAPGRFTLRLDQETAPLAARNFARLAEQRFYDGLLIHRVVPNFAVQDGDPWGDGQGGPGYRLRDERSDSRFAAGTLAMGAATRDAAGSQWFITLADQPQLAGAYTAFGRVVQNFGGVAALLLPHDRVVSIGIYEGDGSEPLPPLGPHP